FASSETCSSLRFNLYARNRSGRRTPNEPPPKSSPEPPRHGPACEPPSPAYAPSRPQPCRRAFFHHHIMPGCIASSNSPGPVAPGGDSRRGHHASRRPVTLTFPPPESRPPAFTEPASVDRLQSSPGDDQHPRDSGEVSR